MLSHHPSPQETGPPPMEGSVLIAVGESEEEVLSVVREDAYVKAGVWDLERVRVIPVSARYAAFFPLVMFFSLLAVVGWFWCLCCVYLVLMTFVVYDSSALLL